MVFVTALLLLLFVILLNTFAIRLQSRMRKRYTLGAFVPAINSPLSTPRRAHRRPRPRPRPVKAEIWWPQDPGLRSLLAEQALFGIDMRIRGEVRRPSAPAAASHAAALLQPHERPGRRHPRRPDLRQQEDLLKRGTRRHQAAPPGQHGLPEIQSLPRVHLRASSTACASRRDPPDGAQRDLRAQPPPRLWDEVKDLPRRFRPRPLRGARCSASASPPSPSIRRSS
ncbi:MAG: hypothetical protein U1F87_07735 [Kiritimatiellia bacterium]